jgi:pSer/pThr/pTyr-binding forkhead associated (FHA) protein
VVWPADPVGGMLLRVALPLLELHPQRGRKNRLRDGAVIGRSADCDLRVEDLLVSRQHARVAASQIGAGIEDLGSANGLYVNGRRTTGISPLHPGDVIQLGGTLWLVLSREG